MAGIFNGPPRGGTRGGRDQFNWENVKSDKDREYYLGHSVKALQGRWQKGKDVYWYTREKDQGEGAAARRQTELQMVKQREEDLMLEALGMKPKAPKHAPQPRLDRQDMEKLLAREEDDPAGQPTAGDVAADADRVRGLGFNASRLTGAIQSGQTHETMQGVGIGTASAALTGTERHPSGAAAIEAGRGHAPSGSRLTGPEEAHAARRQQRKEEKLASKRARKDKKHKRAKKEFRRGRDEGDRRGRSRRRSRSRSLSGSSSGGSSGEDLSDGDRGRRGRRERDDGRSGLPQGRGCRSRSRSGDMREWRRGREVSRSRSRGRRGREERRRSRSRSPRYDRGRSPTRW